jgi:hypothetical protein
MFKDLFQFTEMAKPHSHATYAANAQSFIPHIQQRCQINLRTFVPQQLAVAFHGILLHKTVNN